MNEQTLISELILQDCDAESQRVAKMTGAQIANESAQHITADTYAYIDKSGHISFSEKFDRDSFPADEWQAIGYVEKL